MLIVLDYKYDIRSVSVSNKVIGSADKNVDWIWLWDLPVDNNNGLGLVIHTCIKFQLLPIMIFIIWKGEYSNK